MARGGGKVTLSCAGCKGLFTRFASGVKNPDASYCGRSCLSASKSVDRVCCHCGKSFVTQVGRLSGKTNSSANFCGRECYWASMRKPKASLKGRGSTCQRACADVIAAAPFCASCGTMSYRLEAHHIIPRRRGGTDNRSNLVPLCPTCHKRIEALTRDMERSGLSASMVGAFMLPRLRYRQACTAIVLRKISHERTYSLA